MVSLESRAQNQEVMCARYAGFDQPHTRHFAIMNRDVFSLQRRGEITGNDLYGESSIRIVRRLGAHLSRCVRCAIGI